MALFADSYFESNGVATLCRNLTRYATDRNIPFLCVRGGARTSIAQQNSLTEIELKRSFASFPLDADLYCDPLLSRYKRFVESQLLEFDPDVVHITGPGDLGFLGLWVAHAIGVPLVASWHTNLHEYLSRRLNKTLSFVPCLARARLAQFAEHEALRGLIRFYRMPRFLMAPNPATCAFLESRTLHPAFQMPHGVDPHLFSPVRRHPHSDPFCIGYVGRLTPEKNVRAFVAIEHNLIAMGHRDFKLLLIGEGGERDWLKRHLRFAEFPGVLRNSDLADAYGRMDAFVFPSETDTFGLVLLEASASGVPVVTSPLTGARAGLENNLNSVLQDDLSCAVSQLMSEPRKRESLSQAARRFACSRDWENAFNRLYGIYRAGLEIENARPPALERASTPIST